MKIIFMGTPDFAVPCLQSLIDNGYDVCAVFTQPDKPVGRKQVLTAPPVKQCAVKNDIPVFQPNTLKNDDALVLIKSFDPDLIAVVAYGKILPVSILNCAKYGCINVHASLLPKYRGAAPIQCAILNGDKRTGVTVQQMAEGVDTGDILHVSETDIGINETAEELFDRLSLIGADTLLECIQKIKDGTVNPVKQDESKATHVSKITKDICPVDWSRPALEVHNHIRGLNSWPSAITTLNGKNLKIHKSVLSERTADNFGQVVDNKDNIVVCCGDGRCIEITELQLEGKKRMSASAFLQGNKIAVGTMLGD